MSDVQEFKEWRMDFESDYDAKPTPFQAWQAAKESNRKQVEELRAKLAMQDEVLQKLARLGNGDSFGNSIGNCIAIDAISATSEDVAAWKEKQLAPLQREVMTLYHYMRALQTIQVRNGDRVEYPVFSSVEDVMRNVKATAEAYEQKIRTEAMEEARQVCRDEENKAWAFKGTAAWSSYMEGMSEKALCRASFLSAWEAKDIELAATKQKLEAMTATAEQKSLDSAVRAMSAEQRAEALEAERKELEKQEPVPSDYVFCPEYDETPSGMVQTGGAYIPANPLEIKDGLSCKLYAKPVPPADLQKRIDELEAELERFRAASRDSADWFDQLKDSYDKQKEENAQLTKKLAEWQKAATEREAICVKIESELPTLLSAARAEGVEEGKKMADGVLDSLHRIKQWCEAYPLDIFPEPDFKKAHAVLAEAGMTLDAISASNMRHVLNGIVNHVNDALLAAAPTHKEE